MVDSSNDRIDVATFDGLPCVRGFVVSFPGELGNIDRFCSSFGFVVDVAKRRLLWQPVKCIT